MDPSHFLYVGCFEALYSLPMVSPAAVTSKHSVASLVSFQSDSSFLSVTSKRPHDASFTTKVNQAMLT